MTEAGRTLPSSADSVAAARRFVEQTLDEWGVGEAGWAALQLVSELATNAVIHARSEFRVELRRTEDRLRVAVADTSPAAPGLRHYGPESTTGRGLRLVDSVAARWGVDLQDIGKEVWFDLELGAPQTAKAWDDGEDVDLDALLAQFDDGEDTAVTASMLLAA